jgi:hypothetical protein
VYAAKTVGYQRSSQASIFEGIVTPPARSLVALLVSLPDSSVGYATRQYGSLQFVALLFFFISQSRRVLVCVVSKFDQM